VIDREDIERLKEIFVTRQECDSTVDEINKKLANDMTEFAVIKTKLNAILWGIGVIGSAVIGVLIKMIFER
jgi:hypothetical protein